MKKRVASLIVCLVLILGSFSSCASGGTTDTQSGENTTGSVTDGGNTDVDTDDEDSGAALDSSIATLTPSDSKKIKIAFIGDSITQGTGTTNQSADGYPGQFSAMLDSSKYTVGNFGKASAYTLAADSKYNVKTDASLSYKNTQQYKNSVAFAPDVVVIMLGVNDMRSLTCDEAKSEFVSALAALALEYKAMESVQRVYIATAIKIPNKIAIAPIADGLLQELQREAAEQAEVAVIDMFSITYEYMNVMMHTTSDRLHPNKPIYNVMANVMYSHLFATEYDVPAPAVSESGVVYLSGGGTGDGSSAASPTGSIATAVGLLRKNGGVIVVCGAYSIPYEMHLPKHDGVITITSRYGGVDYQVSGARLGLAAHFFLYGDFVFEHLEMRNEAAILISCRYNDVTFGDGIVSTLGAGVSVNPTIIVGHTIDHMGLPSEMVSLEGECNIVVNSGKWSYISCGNRRSKAEYPVGNSSKDAVLNVTVNGGEFTLTSGNNLSCAVAMNGFSGTCNFTVNGGVFHYKLYALGRIGSNNTKDPSVMSGTVNMVINGGTFHERIYLMQDSTTRLTGKVNITVARGYENKLVGFTNVQVN